MVRPKKNAHTQIKLALLRSLQAKEKKRGKNANTQIKLALLRSPVLQEKGKKKH